MRILDVDLGFERLLIFLFELLDFANVYASCFPINFSASP
jgi:hypothetical protein